METQQLYKILLKFLNKKGYTNIKKGQYFILAEGNIPICLIAHMDTVFPFPQDSDNFLYDPEKKILWGVGGSGFDDRAGIAGIIELLERGFRPHILFTDCEEVGGIGAQELVARYTKFPFKSGCKALIELDRANENDAVYYRCENEKFEEYIESFGFEFAQGTFSDISIIAPVWKIAAVNLSIGYEMEHSPNELIHIDWFESTIEKVESILSNVDSMKKYKYIPRVFSQGKYCKMCGRRLRQDLSGLNAEEFIDHYGICDKCYSQVYSINNLI